MIEDSIPPLLLQIIFTIPIFLVHREVAQERKLVINEECTRK
eukprot:COSAG02_NODE_3102_length_7368_cov_92.599120_1_plen_42_part_00